MGKAQKIEVDTKLVHNASTDLGEKAEKYGRTFADLHSKVEDEMKNYWSGADYEAFRKMVNDYQKHFTNLKSLLDKFSVYLDGAAKNYEKMVDINISDANKLPK